MFLLSSANGAWQASMSCCRSAAYIGVADNFVLVCSRKTFPWAKTSLHLGFRCGGAASASCGCSVSLFCVCKCCAV